MKIKTYYIADDNTEHETMEQAKDHNIFIADIAKAIEPLGKRYKGQYCDYENGSGYVQHNPISVLEAKKNIIAICKIKVPHKIWDYPAGEIHPHSFACRLLSERNSFLYAAWRRFMMIDEQGREWGQPYYASHPEAATMKELENRVEMEKGKK